MAILSRFKDIMASNIHALLDKCEDPVKMSDQYLRNALSDLADVKQETASIMAEEKRTRAECDTYRKQVERYEGLINKALDANNEGDALTFADEKLKYDKQLETATAVHQRAKQNADQMRELHDKLVTDIEELRAIQANTKSMNSVAKAQERAQGVLNNSAKRESAVNAMNRMQEKAQTRLNKANSLEELNRTPANAAEEAAAKYGAHGDAVSELDRIKALIVQKSGGGN